MPGTTPNYDLPYPLATDPVRDGENTMQALAEQIDTYLVQVHDISGIDTSDELVAFLVGDDTTATHAALRDQVQDAPVNVYTGKAEYNGGFTAPYDTDVWIAGPARTDPTLNSQGLYIQHRVIGNLGGLVNDAGAAELRIYSGTNTGAGQSAFEASLVVLDDGNAINSLNAVTANLHGESVPTGTIESVAMYRAQAVPSMGGLVADKIYGVYVEPQTVGGSENWSVYAPGGTSLFQTLRLDSAAPSTARALQFSTNGVLRWILRTTATAESGAQAGSDLELNARTDAGVSNLTPVSISRSSGLVSLNNGLKVTGNLGFYGTAPIAKPAALTAANSSAVNSGDATTDAVINNMRTRIGELQTKLQSLGLIA